METKGAKPMKKIIIFCFFVAACATAFAIVYDESNFHALGRMYQPAPDGYVPGKDNDQGLGTHHPGENCGLCHNPQGRAKAYLFTMAGTLYDDRSGRSVAKGGEIIMEDRKGNIISMTSNEVGNFFTKASFASDPYSVGSYHGGPPFEPLYKEDSDGNLIQPADPSDSRTWKYKTWVKKGTSVRPMVTITGVGGGEAAPRMSCSMHHGGVAHRSGALWVGKRSVLDSYPASGLSYRRDIYPILRSNCAPCHIPGKTMTPVNTKTDLAGNPSTSIDYSGGLDLMFYDGSSVRVSGVAIEKMGVKGVVNTQKPEDSPLLRKTLTGGGPHAGGAFWNNRHPDYIALRRWIAEGAVNN
jgi:hypothetical protein